MFEDLRLTEDSVVRVELMLHDIFKLLTCNIFYLIRWKGIRSDKGFFVEKLGRYGLIYSDGKKRVYMYSEIVPAAEEEAHPFNLYIAIASMRIWENFRLSRAISKEEKDEIINNIRELFRPRGLEVKVNYAGMDERD